MTDTGSGGLAAAPPRSLLRDILLGALPRALNGFTTLGLNLYAARFLDPAEFAFLGLGTTCFIMADGILGAALDLSTATRLRESQPGPRPEQAELAAVALKLMLGALLLVAAALSGEWLGWRVFQRPGGRVSFLLIAIAATAVLFLRSVQLFYQLRFRFERSGLLDLSLSLLRAGSIAGLLAAGVRSGTTLLAAHAASMAIVGFVFGAHLLRGRLASLQPARDLMRQTSRAFVTFAVGSLVSRLDLLLVAARGHAAETGYYTAAMTLMTIPEVVASYLSPILLPRIGLHRAAGTFAGFFRRALLLTVAGAGLAWALSAALLGPVFHRIYSAQFEPVLPLQRILLPGALAAASLMPLTLNFVVSVRPQVFLVADCAFAFLLWMSYLTMGQELSVIAGAVSVLRMGKALAVHTTAYRMSQLQQKFDKT